MRLNSESVLLLCIMIDVTWGCSQTVLQNIPTLNYKEVDLFDKLKAQGERTFLYLSDRYSEDITCVTGVIDKKEEEHWCLTISYFDEVMESQHTKISYNEGDNYLFLDMGYQTFKVYIVSFSDYELSVYVCQIGGDHTFVAISVPKHTANTKEGKWAVDGVLKTLAFWDVDAGTMIQPLPCK